MYSGIKAVVLDIDGTLCSLTRGVGEIYAELLTVKGHIVERPKLIEAIAIEWQAIQPLYLNETQSYRTTPDREREVWYEYIRRVLARVGLGSAIEDDVIGYIYRTFATKEHRAVAPGALEFLDKAYERGVLVFAATNNDDRSKSVLRELGALKTLSGVFTAGELGWKKPSTRFYETLKERLGFASSELVHVGNDIALDIQPARRAGWNAILFGPSDDLALSSVSSFAKLAKMMGL